MEFKDIEWKPRFKDTPDIDFAFMGNIREAKYAKIGFDNGHGASILCGDMFYSNGVDTYELAVMNNNEICYDTPITDDVCGYLNQDELMQTLEDISKLPPRD